MKSIPLVSPSGHTYAYACGVCDHVSAGSSLLGWDPNRPRGPHESLVESSLLGAERCCRCHCGNPITLQREMRYQHFSGETQDVEWREFQCTECVGWRGIAQLWASIGEAIENKITTPTAWEAFIWARWKEDTE